ncbi:MAG TPA: hypothetical protein VMN39_02795, partial [Longimicrobiaceae bacterium]|nr:hypothetical protein [Longimicrobiaceae bacterium]
MDMAEATADPPPRALPSPAPPPAGGSPPSLGDVDLAPRRFRGFGSIVVEFAIIVLGVLAALAVEEWREGRADARLERHFLESLAGDLERDSADFAGFARHQGRRALAADAFLLAAGHPVADPRRASAVAEVSFSPASALALLGSVNHLEPSRASFTAMLGTGGMALVSDEELRSGILRYYSVVDDRADIHATILPELTAYRRRLEGYGHTHSDGDAIRAGPMLADPTLLALVRGMREHARLATRYGE